MIKKQNISYLGDGLSESSGITADSEPVYDIPFYPFDEAWSCRDWITWHKRMKEKYGKQEANDRFLQAWDDQNFFEWNKSFCKYGDEFVEYFDKQGLDPGNFVSKITRNAVDAGVNITEGAKSVSSGLTDLSLNKVLLVAVLAGTAYLATPFMPVIKEKVKDWIQ